MRRRGLPILVAVLLVIIEAHLSFGEERSLKGRLLDDRTAKWQITANKMSYREKEGLYVAEGDVVITRDGQMLSSQRAVYDEKRGIAEVSGDVRLEANGDLITGDEGTFDLESYTGKITNGCLFIRKNNFYVYGDTMEKVGPSSYVVKGCRMTTCDGIRPDWSITGSEVRVTIEGYGSLRHAAFRIRNIPVFYLPYAIFPVKTERQTGLLPPRLGYSNRNGIDVEVPFFWAISDQTDATLYERFMGRRGFMQGFEFRYLAEHDSKGTFLFDILSDRIEEKDMDDPEDVELTPFSRTNSTRYWLRSRAEQQLPLGLRARLDADLVSDQDYMREFRGGLFGFEARPDLAGESGRPVEETQSPTRRSALRVSRDRDEYSLQALASYHQRPENPAEDETPQPLSGLDLAILPRPLANLPLFLRFDTDYDWIWRDMGLKGHRLSFSPELSYPMWFGRYLQFEPAISLTRDKQWLDDHYKDIDHRSRDAYKIQTRLSTIFEKTFDLEWKGTKMLKHKVSPALTYEFRVPKDEDRFRPWFEPIDVEGKINRITFSFDNLLDARSEDDKGGMTYTQWSTLSLSQGYDINEARRDEEPWREKNPFEPLVGILTLKPFPDLYLDAEARWDHEEDEMSFADTSFELSVKRSGGRKDRYKIDYIFVEGENENLNYSLDVNLLYGFSAGTSIKRDLRAGREIQSSYWLEYQSQCWAVRLTTERLDSMDSIMVLFRLTGLGM